MTTCEPVTVAIGVAAGLTILSYIFDYSTEKCTDYWIDTQLNDFNKNLRALLHGQHLVKDIVPKIISNHMMNNNPDKALVISFHGWSGTGKTFTTEILAKNIFRKYRESGKSDFVHRFSCDQFMYYNKELVREWIKNNLTNTIKRCERSLFIFDEMEKLPEGVIDVIKPFIDYNTPYEMFKKSIFIFLSNAGEGAIEHQAYQFYKLGINRPNITWKDFEPLVRNGTFNEKGGLYNSEIVDKHLINAYVPFLPLEKKHVKCCVNDYLNLHYSNLDPDTDRREELMTRVANDMEYSPPDIEIFSRQGCKNIKEKIAVYIDEYGMQQSQVKFNS